MLVMRENIFLCLGSPLVDIITKVDEEFLKRYNLKPNDAIAVNETNRKLFGDLQEFQLKYQAGGCALNTARTFQWALKIPNISVVVGAIGKDNYSNILKDCLSRELVSYKFVEIEKETTGKCAVLLNGNNRSLCTDLGASKFFELQHLDNGAIWDAVENAQYYYIPAFFLGVSVDCLQKVAKHSLTEGKTFAFNLSAPFLAEKYKTEMLALLPFVDILFGNEAEARAFARALDFGSSDLHEIVLHINNFRAKTSSKNRMTVITRGPHPVCVAVTSKVQEYAVNKLEEGSVKDTSAAGDAFVGGFMAQFVMKRPLDQCVLCGISTAGRIIQNIGCSF